MSAIEPDGLKHASGGIGEAERRCSAHSKADGWDERAREPILLGEDMLDSPTNERFDNVGLYPLPRHYSMTIRASQGIIRFAPKL